MISEKKARKQLHRIWFHWVKLQKVLNEAHNDELIKYTDYLTEAPCQTMTELKDRIERTTEKQLSYIIQQGMRNKHW